MPVYYHSSPQKSNGFSIDDLIKTSSITYPSPSYLSPITWLPPSPSNIYQSMLQYLRQTNQFPHPSTAAFFLNTYRKPKRNRTAFTPTQLLKLENEFEKNPYIVGQERKELAKHLNLPESKVKVWYQNRRTKQKRLKTDDHDHLNESDTTIKIDDEHSCNDPLQQDNSCSN